MEEEGEDEPGASGESMVWIGTLMFLEPVASDMVQQIYLEQLNGDVGGKWACMNRNLGARVFCIRPEKKVGRLFSSQ
jgi:hypothetical protein